MTAADAKGEHAALLDLEVGEDVRLELEVRSVADQPGVAEGEQQTRVARAPDEIAQFAPGMPELGHVVDHKRLVRWLRTSRTAQREESQRREDGGAVHRRSPAPGDVSCGTGRNGPSSISRNWPEPLVSV